MKNLLMCAALLAAPAARGAETAAKTQLGEMDWKSGVVIVKKSYPVKVFKAGFMQGEPLGINAARYAESGGTAAKYGLVIIRKNVIDPPEIRIDEDEVDALMNALQQLADLKPTENPEEEVSAQYRTKWGLIFRAKASRMTMTNSSGKKVVKEKVECRMETTAGSFLSSLDGPDLSRLKTDIAEAKAKLAALKQK